MRLLLLVFLCAFVIGIQTSFSQLQEQTNYTKSLNLHLFDLMRFSSPALKISFQDEAKSGRIIGYEASIIYDFNADILRLNTSERGILGTSLSYFYMFKMSSDTNESSSIGFRANYSHKRRSIEKWVSKSSFAYRQKMNYTQINDNLGIYLRITYNSVNKSRFRFGTSLNLGYLLLNVQNDLPDDASPILNSFFFSPTNYFNNHKLPGLHYYPHLYFEINMGYAFN